MATDVLGEYPARGGRLSHAARGPGRDGATRRPRWEWGPRVVHHGALGDVREMVTDEELAARAREDPEAFGELYERYVHRIHGFIRSRLPHRPTAEDLTAEVFFKALRAIEQYQPGRPFRAWLFQIATNTVTDHFRRHRAAVPLEEVADRADGGPAVEDHALARAELDRVRAAMETLNDGQRTALALRLGQDMNTAEIAACMGRSEGAVKLLIHRGLHAVRQQLEALVPPAGERA